MIGKSKDQWFGLVELAALVEGQHPKLGAMKRATKRKYMWRLIRRIELRDGERYTKLAGRDLLVSRRALESLLPKDQQVLTGLETSFGHLAQEHRALRRQVNDHGARIRVLERKERITRKYLDDMAQADRDANET